MLNFFPEIYPDELWYSVLCRYHIRSGNSYFISTMDELFGKEVKYISVGSLFPNNSIYLINKQLPNGILDMDDIISNHTLFPFFVRMRSIKEKMNMIDMIKAGNSKNSIVHWRTSTKRNNFLKFCPICQADDIKNYGESYWHCSHQIPLITTCYKHKCKLISYEYKRNDTINEKFVLPIDYSGLISTSFNASEDELFLTSILYDYFKMPYDIGPTQNYNNLWYSLLNSEYGNIYKMDKQSINIRKIKEDLDAKFGEDITNLAMGGENKYCKYSVLIDWVLKSPERYAVLAALIKQPAYITFGEKLSEERSTEEISNKMMVQILKRYQTMAKQTNTIYKKKYIANKLKITPQQLDFIAKKEGIEPFWAHNDSPRKVHLSCHVTQKEKDQIDTYVLNSKYASISELLRVSVLKEIRNRD